MPSSHRFTSDITRWTLDNNSSLPRIIRSGHSNLVNKSFVAKGFVSFPAVCDYGTIQTTFLITKGTKLEAEKSIMWATRTRPIVSRNVQGISIATTTLAFLKVVRPMSRLLLPIPLKQSSTSTAPTNGSRQRESSLILISLQVASVYSPTPLKRMFHPSNDTTA